MRIAASGALLVLTATSGALAQAADIYGSRCAVCHRPDGSGSTGISPPLAENVGRYASSERGRAYLARVLLYGMRGPISVRGRHYDGFMPPFPQLADAEIAAVLNLVLTEFDPGLIPEDFEPLTTEEVASERDRRLSPGEVAASRRALRTGFEADEPSVGAVVEDAVSESAAGGDSIGSSNDADTTAGKTIRGPALHYISHCQGCHGASGRGIPDAVPTLQDSLGHFLRLPEGRAYLVRVPGVARAPLSDAEIADLLNWMLERFGGDRLPEDFRPYTADEIGRYRADRLVDVSGFRAMLVERLAR